MWAAAIRALQESDGLFQDPEVVLQRLELDRVLGGVPDEPPPTRYPLGEGVLAGDGTIDSEPTSHEVAVDTGRTHAPGDQDVHETNVPTAPAAEVFRTAVGGQDPREFQTHVVRIPVVAFSDGDLRKLVDIVRAFASRAHDDFSIRADVHDSRQKVEDLGGVRTVDSLTCVGTSVAHQAARTRRSDAVGWHGHRAALVLKATARK